MTSVAFANFHDYRHLGSNGCLETEVANEFGRSTQRGLTPSRYKRKVSASLNLRRQTAAFAATLSVLLLLLCYRRWKKSQIFVRLLRRRLAEVPDSGHCKSYDLSISSNEAQIQEQRKAPGTSKDETPQLPHKSDTGCAEPGRAVSEQGQQTQRLHEGAAVREEEADAYIPKVTHAPFAASARGSAEAAPARTERDHVVEARNSNSRPIIQYDNEWDGSARSEITPREGASNTKCVTDVRPKIRREVVEDESRNRAMPRETDSRTDQKKVSKKKTHKKRKKADNVGSEVDEHLSRRSEPGASSRAEGSASPACAPVSRNNSTAAERASAVQSLAKKMDELQAAKRLHKTSRREIQTFISVFGSPEAGGQVASPALQYGLDWFRFATEYLGRLLHRVQRQLTRFAEQHEIFSQNAPSAYGLSIDTWLDDWRDVQMYLESDMADTMGVLRHVSPQGITFLKSRHFMEHMRVLCLATSFLDEHREVELLIRQIIRAHSATALLGTDAAREPAQPPTSASSTSDAGLSSASRALLPLLHELHAEGDMLLRSVDAVLASGLVRHQVVAFIFLDTQLRVDFSLSEIRARLKNVAAAGASPATSPEGSHRSADALRAGGNEDIGMRSSGSSSGSGGQSSVLHGAVQGFLSRAAIDASTGPGQGIVACFFVRLRTLKLARAAMQAQELLAMQRQQRAAAPVPPHAHADVVPSGDGLHSFWYDDEGENMGDSQAAGGAYARIQELRILGELRRALGEARLIGALAESLLRDPVSDAGGETDGNTAAEENDNGLDVGLGTDGNGGDGNTRSSNDIAGASTSNGSAHSSTNYLISDGEARNTAYMLRSEHSEDDGNTEQGDNGNDATNRCTEDNAVGHDRCGEGNTGSDGTEDDIHEADCGTEFNGGDVDSSAGGGSARCCSLNRRYSGGFDHVDIDADSIMNVHSYSSNDDEGADRNNDDGHNSSSGDISAGADDSNGDAAEINRGNYTESNSQGRRDANGVAEDNSGSSSLSRRGSGPVDNSRAVHAHTNNGSDNNSDRRRQITGPMRAQLLGALENLRVLQIMVGELAEILEDLE